jgi:hypothetical protein
MLSAAAPRGRTPPPLARRLDRLARRAHAFHRFAHHPLCGGYADEVVRLGRRARICRGCALAWSGAALGAAAGLALPWLPTPALALAGAVGAALALRGARPRGGATRSKLASRALPAALVAILPAHALRRPGPATVTLAIVALVLAAAAVAAYRRRGPDRALCASCPERDAPRACSGYAPVVRRERAFARVAARLIAARGRGPIQS